MRLNEDEMCDYIRPQARRKVARKRTIQMSNALIKIEYVRDIPDLNVKESLTLIDLTTEDDDDEKISEKKYAI